MKVQNADAKIPSNVKTCLASPENKLELVKIVWPSAAENSDAPITNN